MPAIHRPRETAAKAGALFGGDPFRVSAALAAGLSEGQLRAARNAGVLVRLRPGVLALPAPDGDPVRRAALAALLCLAPAAVVSHVTAGHLHVLPSRRPGERSAGVVVSAPVTGRRRAGIHVIEAEVDPPDVTEAQGVRCTSVARTALDLARRRPVAEALVVLDAAVARGGSAALLDARRRLAGTRGLAALDRAVALADPRAESPLESASRGVVIDGGLPTPELQAWIVDDEGRAWRVDFLWRDARVIGEADGWVKYETVEDVRAEKRREDALRRAGWTVVRWTSDELWRRPDLVRRRIAASLGR